MKSKFIIELDTTVSNTIEYDEYEIGGDNQAHLIKKGDKIIIDKHFHDNFAKALTTALEWNDGFQENILDYMDYEGHNFDTIFKKCKVKVTKLK